MTSAQWFPRTSSPVLPVVSTGNWTFLPSCPIVDTSNTLYPEWSFSLTKPVSVPLLWHSAIPPVYQHLAHGSHSANRTPRNEWMLPVAQAGILKLTFDLIFPVTDHIQFSASACQFSIWYIFLYSFLQFPLPLSGCYKRLLAGLYCSMPFPC